jgi:hypothetical protein
MNSKTIILGVAASVSGVLPAVAHGHVSLHPNAIPVGRS